MRCQYFNRLRWKFLFETNAMKAKGCCLSEWTIFIVHHPSITAMKRIWNMKSLNHNNYLLEVSRCNSNVGFPEKLVRQVNVMNVRCKVDGSMQYTFTLFILLIFHRMCLCHYDTWESQTIIAFWEIPLHNYSVITFYLSYIYFHTFHCKGFQSRPFISSNWLSSLRWKVYGRWKVITE